MPADLTGTRVYHQHTGEFETSRGPVFTNLLLADEINRAPAKVQSALLEVMQERQVTIGRETFPVPSPFLVMATQNPIESEGTYPLPEAQVDRFMLKVVVRYPTTPEEHAIVERALHPGPSPQSILTARRPGPHAGPGGAGLRRPRRRRLRRAAGRGHPGPGTVGLGDLERYVTYGASPRASIALLSGGRALAFLRGRDYVLPQDVGELALTCCGTGSCCPTRPWPTTSTPTRSSPAC